MSDLKFQPKKLSYWPLAAKQSIDHHHKNVKQICNEKLMQTCNQQERAVVYF